MKSQLIIAKHEACAQPYPPSLGGEGGAGKTWWRATASESKARTVNELTRLKIGQRREPDIRVGGYIADTAQTPRPATARQATASQVYNS